MIGVARPVGRGQFFVWECDCDFVVGGVWEGMLKRFGVSGCESDTGYMCCMM